MCALQLPGRSSNDRYDHPADQSGAGAPETALVWSGARRGLVFAGLVVLVTGHLSMVFLFPAGSAAGLAHLLFVLRPARVVFDVVLPLDLYLASPAASLTLRCHVKFPSSYPGRRTRIGDGAVPPRPLGLSKG